jgi:DNA-binding transcriptional LysR family regulator
VPVTAISDLEIFARIAAAGNMSAAGRDLGLSPAVISKRLSHMEERLGARLFQRTTRQLKLTEAGEGFFDKISGILDSIEEAEAFVSALNHKVGGLLRITAPISFAAEHIAPYLPEFLKRHPDLSMEFILRDEMVDIVGESIDLAIRIAELNDSSLVARKLASCRRVMCATPEYLEKNGTPQTLAELQKHVCLTAGHRGVWKLMGPHGKTETVRTTSRLRTNCGLLVHEAHLQGMGIALRSTWAVSRELRSGKLRIVLPEYRENAGVAVYAVYPCRQYVPAKLKAFVDFLAQRYGPTPYWDRDLDFGADGRLRRVQPSIQAAE